MTARRRRKSGSGPSATALIAWVGGARAASFDHASSDPVGASACAVGGPRVARSAGGRAILLGRACGLTAGTVLAVGSVLVGATNVRDGSLVGEGAPLLNFTPVAPSSGADTPGTNTPVEYPAEVPAEPAAAAPEQVSVQAVTGPAPGLHPPLGKVRRNAPVTVGSPAPGPSPAPGAAAQPRTPPPPATGPAPSGPVTPVSPVLDPAAKGVGRVAPVGGVLAPSDPGPDAADPDMAADPDIGVPRDARGTTVGDEPASLRTPGPVGAVQRVVAPVTEVIQPALQPVTQSVIRPIIRPVVKSAKPAMAMLTSLLPIG